MMIDNSLRTVLALSFVFACNSGSSDAKKSGKPAEAPANVAVQPAGPWKTDPKTLFADLASATPGRTERYRDGATFTGVITESKLVMAEHKAFVTTMDVDGTNYISLVFADPEDARPIKAGDTMTVTCKSISDRNIAGGAVMATGCTK